MNVLSHLSRREQVLVVCAAILVGVLIILQFAVMPVIKGKSDSKIAHATAIRDMDIVRRSVPRAGGSTQSKPRQNFDRDSVINAARGFGLSISRMQPGSDGDLQFWFDDAQASGVYQLLSGLTAEYAVVIQRADIKRREGGTVSAHVTLRAIP